MEAGVDERLSMNIPGFELQTGRNNEIYIFIVGCFYKLPFDGFIMTIVVGSLRF